MCSPQLLKDRPLPLPAQALLEFPLLHLRGENSSNWFDWSGLFRELGITTPPAPGQLRFDNYTLLIQAAIGGQGVAIGWRHLVDNLLVRVCCAGRWRKPRCRDSGITWCCRNANAAGR